MPRPPIPSLLPLLIASLLPVTQEPGCPVAMHTSCAPPPAVLVPRRVCGQCQVGETVPK